MQSVVILNVIILIVARFNVIMLSTFGLIIIMRSVIILSVIVLSVVAPLVNMAKHTDMFN
jgi:hypothetical protein